MTPHASVSGFLRFASFSFPLRQRIHPFTYTAVYTHLLLCIYPLALASRFFCTGYAVFCVNTFFILTHMHTCTYTYLDTFPCMHSIYVHATSILSYDRVCVYTSSLIQFVSCVASSFLLRNCHNATPAHSLFCISLCVYAFLYHHLLMCFSCCVPCFHIAI